MEKRSFKDEMILEVIPKAMSRVSEFLQGRYSKRGYLSATRP